MTAREHLAQWCSHRGLDPSADIQAPDRRREAVNVRQEAAAELRAAGHSLPEIGRAMDRDHSTILYLLRRAPPGLQAPSFRIPQATAANVICSCCTIPRYYRKQRAARPGERE